MDSLTSFLDSIGRTATGVVGVLNGQKATPTQSTTPKASTSTFPTWAMWLIGGGAVLALVVILASFARKG